MQKNGGAGPEQHDLYQNDTGAPRHQPSWLPRVSFNHPAIWLAYLPLFFIPWGFQRPSPAQMTIALVGLALFLVLYFVSSKVAGRRLLAVAAAVLLLSCVLAFTGSNWTVIAIYAAAMVAELRPPRRAAVLVCIFSAASTVFALATSQPIWMWIIGTLLMLMIGFATISRTVLEDNNRALAASQDEVRQLAASAERERIGRDMHDLLGRTLTLIAIKADLAERLAHDDADRATAEMRDIAAAARQGLADVRAAISGMTGASLSHEITASRAALTAADIQLEIEGDAAHIDPGTGAVLAMVLREAVTNIIRHSDAAICRVVFHQQPAGLQMVVTDDGDGAEMGVVNSGRGIAGLRSRLTAAGGDLLIQSTGEGISLTARVPQGAPA